MHFQRKLIRGVGGDKRAADRRGNGLIDFKNRQRRWRFRKNLARKGVRILKTPIMVGGNRVVGSRNQLIFALISMAGNGHLTSARLLVFGLPDLMGSRLRSRHRWWSSGGAAPEGTTHTPPPDVRRHIYFLRVRLVQRETIEVSRPEIGVRRIPPPSPPPQCR